MFPVEIKYVDEYWEWDVHLKLTELWLCYVIHLPSNTTSDHRC